MRKPVEDLNASDLEQFPVWAFGGDGDEDDDETWVHSLANGTVPESDDVLCVAAAVRLSCGSVYPAVLFAEVQEEMVVNAVALLTTQGQVLFGRGDPAKETRQNLRRLGLSEAQVFPLDYATRAPIAATGAIAVGSFSP